MTIDDDRFDDINGVLVAEASDLEWPPGKFAANFHTHGEQFVMDRSEIDQRENELLWIEYKSESGKKAKVFND